MELLKVYALPCVFAFAACMGFSLLYNVRGVGNKLLAAAGGALGWLIYLLAARVAGSALVQCFLAALAVSAWAETMARLRKTPTTTFLILGLYPLVPGGGIYYSMEHARMGETSLFLDTLLHTLGLAGALAVGVLLVASAVRLATTRWRRQH